MKTTRLLAAIVLCLTLVSVAEAKWWIFGQANDEVTLSYLYINDISSEDVGEKITVYRDMLTNGEVVMRGKARIGKGKIGGASVSLDNRVTWKDAQFSTDGAFEYRFRPELGKTYVIYVEVVDTAGKANDIESTRKELIIAEGSYQQQVRAALDALIAAYRAEDPTTFMRYVSENFAADPAVLDRAIRGDFSLFDNIDLRYTLNNIATGQGGVFVSLSFSRQITSARDGKTYNDKGITEFTFQPTEQGFKVLSMKYPLIFGLSDSDEVATGIVNSGSTDPTLVVQDNGTLVVVPFNQAQDDDDSTVESGTNINITSDGHTGGFDFVEGEVVTNGSGAFTVTGAEEALRFYAWLDNGSEYKDLGSVAISTITEAPDSGYINDTGMGQYFYEGHTYAFHLENGNYALMTVKSISSNFPAHPPTITVRIDYKYQPNGTRNF